MRWRGVNAKTCAVVVVALSTLVTGCTLLDSAGSGSPPLRTLPNVLIIVTDDQPLGTMGVMPKTRRFFGAQGRRFDPGFVTSPVCCPARASIFTGRYVHNHGVVTNIHWGELDHSTTMQHYLKQRGYFNGLFGKFLNNWPVEEDPPRFHRWASVSSAAYRDGRWNVNGRTKKIPTYSTRFIERQAIRFLQEADENDARPWFLYVATAAPHAPFVAEKKYARAQLSSWNGDPAVAERDRSDKPRFIQEAPQTLESGRRRRRLQLRTLFSVDDLVGRLANQLRSLDEERRTLAFFISDNGYLWGQHGFANKTVPYTPSITVPFYMRWRGQVKAGTVDDRMAANIDIAPTVLAAARISAPSDPPMDGRPLLDDWRRDDLFFEYQHYGQFVTPGWASIRTRDYQYVEYYDGSKVAFREYYDLRADPWQLDNLLGDADPSNDPDVSDLGERLATYRQCAASGCP